MLGWEARQGPGAPLSCAYRLLEPRQAVVTARLAFTAVRPYPTRRGARLLMVRVVELEELSRPARNLNPGSEECAELDANSVRLEAANDREGNE